MCRQKEIIFDVHIYDEAVKQAIKQLEDTCETKTVRDANMAFYKALLASTTISVPESQLNRVLPFIDPDWKSRAR